jgi:ABC-type dipeptide/oligopeptide/nickel transport system ATPase component
MSSVSYRGIEKRFDQQVLALKSLDLDVPDGDFLVLLGPSGCGKTTALRILAGLELPTAGTVFIGDRDVTRIQPRDRDIAMVFQSYALYPHMTVAENVGYPLRIRGLGKAEPRAGAARVRVARDRPPARPPPRQALGRPAPARRAGAGDRARALRLPDGRAALEPRRQAAHVDARRDQAPADAARDDHPVRHARPGRGDDHGRPRRRHARGRAAAARARRTRSTTGPPTASWARSSAARR